MMVSTVEANVGNNFPNRPGFIYSYDNSVYFVERGIEFFVFTNGEFDFDTRFTNRGLRIRRNFRGQIRRVGNVFINYDRFGNVTRIGNVFIDYRFGRLHRVGDLRVRYDSWGAPIFFGNVRDFYFDNGVRININIGDVFGYNDAFFFRNNFRRNYIQFREDRNFYYYKARPNANIGKRSHIIKRRKPANLRDNRNIRRDHNNRYRKPSNINRNDRRNDNRDFERRDNERRDDNRSLKKRDNDRRDDRNFNRKNDRRNNDRNLRKSNEKRSDKSYRKNDRKEKRTVRNRRD